MLVVAVLVESARSAVVAVMRRMIAMNAHAVVG